MEQKGRVKSETGGIQMGTFRIIKGDITKCRADAIVNAANPSLLGGGGVDGAIHRAAGPELLEECRTLNGCRPGEAKITKGYRLPADYVIHTPGPVYRGGNCGEEQILASCYRNSLKLAACYERNTVAFPSISTGIYGYPVSLAAKTAVREILTFLHTQSTVREVVMVCFDEETKKAYEEAYREIGQTEFVIRKAGEADLADIQKLMETTVAYMENPDWFYEDGKEFLETCVKEEENAGFAVIARTKQEGIPAGCFLVEIPGDVPYNLGNDLGFSKEQLLLSAHMDTAAVDPLYRGHHLQDRMMEVCEEEMKKRGMRYLLATVHPDNPYSLSNVQKRGYGIRATKEKYGRSLRHILCKEI